MITLQSAPGQAAKTKTSKMIYSNNSKTKEMMAQAHQQTKARQISTDKTTPTSSSPHWEWPMDTLNQMIKIDSLMLKPMVRGIK